MTAQWHERLVHEGQEMGMRSTPLEAYFAQQGERPRFVASCTACWRGYLGSWEVRDGRLYLIGLSGQTLQVDEARFRAGRAVLRRQLREGTHSGRDHQAAMRALRRGVEATRQVVEVSVGTLFPGLHEVHAGWFTGQIEVPQGDLLDTAPGDDPVHERDLILELREGILIDQRVVSNEDPGWWRCWQALTSPPHG